MNSSSPPVTPGQEPHLPSSSSSPPTAAPPLSRPSLQDPELQAEFLRERQNKLGLHGDMSVTSSPSVVGPTPPSSPWSSSPSSPLPSPHYGNGSAHLSLSSPELLAELSQSRTRSLRHVPAHSAMTTVFSGRGRRGQVKLEDAP